MAFNSPTLVSNQRAIAQRRMRRRTLGASRRMFCSTNGCTTYLDLDEGSGVASCPVCGYRRTTRSLRPS